MESDKFEKYNPSLIENKWTVKWEEDGIYNAKNNVKGKENYFALSMFPYPSGNLHIGHWYAFAPADAHARFRRMQGYNVMHPQGFDSFGLPAENAAIENGINPSKWTLENINNFRKEFRSMGTSYDWSRELVTSDPEYYKWNQHFFLEFYNNNLAYRASGLANWCPKDQTTLANEQVKDGSCERCGTEVLKKELPQWFFRITDYAEELLDMDKINWPEKIKMMQRNWIGKSIGVTIKFDLGEFIEGEFIETFTTRIDTIFGVTFIVLSPEHKILKSIIQDEQRDSVYSYIENAARISEIERTSTERDKTGVFTGAYCINPLNNERIPIYVGDYVLSSYGTGAVMGVPAHDQRDYIFAKKYNLEIRVVVKPEENININEAWVEEGNLINSGEFSGLNNNLAKDTIADFIEEKKLGTRTITYHLRDWLISRQRYWGTPIPIIYCEQCGTVPVPFDQLPVLLPDNVEFNPTGKSPLTLNKEFLYTTCPKCGDEAKRETDTMDTFVDSSWYHFKFMSPDSKDVPFKSEDLINWGPIHQYMGGAEHAVMHLLYSRFFTKALRDLNYVNISEPYTKLFNQGMLIKDHKKISKRSNPLNPDPVIQKYGSDTLRSYLMFLGPWDQGGDWSDSGINGIYRWLNRVWAISISIKKFNDVGDQKKDETLIVFSHKTTKKILEDMESFKFNTAIASMMEYTNFLYKIYEEAKISKELWNESIRRLILHMAPIAPYISVEIWNRIGNNNSIHLQNVPEYNDLYTISENITLVIQVNGKVRDQIKVSSSIKEEEALRLAVESKKVQKFLINNTIRKKIFIKGKLVNIVAN